jgi:hypothetical protein
MLAESSVRNGMVGFGQNQWNKAYFASKPIMHLVTYLTRYTRELDHCYHRFGTMFREIAKR